MAGGVGTHQEAHLFRMVAALMECAARVSGICRFHHSLFIFNQITVIVCLIKKSYIQQHYVDFPIFAATF